MTFYRKTVLTEAWHYPFAADVPQVFRDAIRTASSGVPYLVTREGDSYIVDDCWIACGGAGEFRRVDNDIFAAMYEEVQPEVTSQPQI